MTGFLKIWSSFFKTMFMYQLRSLNFFQLNGVRIKTCLENILYNMRTYCKVNIPSSDCLETKTHFQVCYLQRFSSIYSFVHRIRLKFPMQFHHIRISAHHVPVNVSLYSYTNNWLRSESNFKPENNYGTIFFELTLNLNIFS